MATVRDLRTLAKTFGATVNNRSTRKVNAYGVEAPAGHIWDCRDVHEIVIESAAGPAAWLAEAIDDAMESMRLGVSPCSHDECEWCQDTRE